MKSSCYNIGRTVFGGLAASALIWGVSAVSAGSQHGQFVAQDLDKAAAAESTATAAATADSTPRPQIDGVGAIARPGGRTIGPGRQAQFLISGVANEQATPQFLAGGLIYVDRKSHISLITEKIETVTINGDQGAFTGTARIGGPRNKQTVQFTVMVTANRDFPSEHTFSIVLSNGYAASGNLKSGEIVIHDVDPD